MLSRCLLHCRRAGRRKSGEVFFYCVAVARTDDNTAHIHLMCACLSVLLGCSCCSTVDETLENVARGLASRMKRERSHWAAGRVGDIDFIGSTKMRGKVKADGTTEAYVTVKV